MKKLSVLILLLLSLISYATAEDGECPADKAGEAGYKAIEEFHQILAPIWHVSWPEKDYNALLEAGPKFVSAFKGIVKLKPTFKTKKRDENFNNNRDNFARLVKEFNEACSLKENEKAYKIMPHLHDAFEITASCLLPVNYPELEGMIITLNIIIENHLPNENMNGIINSTETLVNKMQGLNKNSIPDDLKELEKDILIDFVVMKKLITQMKETCDNKDMDNYKSYAIELNKKINSFKSKYI